MNPLLTLMKIWNRDHQSYFLLMDGNTAEYRIVTDEFISFWDERSFTKIINNNSFNKDAKKIQSKIVVSKWKSLKDDYDVKALLWSAGNFHDSHIVRILERNEYTDVLFDTTWGQFVALRLYNIKTFNVMRLNAT